MDTGIEYGLSRYYHSHDTTRKDSRGYNGVYDIIDRTTGEVIASVDTYSDAQDKVSALDKKDKIARGIKVIDMIEIPFSYREGRRTVTEVTPPTIHK